MRMVSTPLGVGVDRRRFLALGGGAVASAALIGCSSGEGSGEDGEIGGTVRFAWWGNAGRQQIYTEFAEAFTEVEPDVTVQVEPAEYSGYLDRLAIQAGGRDLPDVFWLPANQVTSFAANEVLLDVETLPDGVLDLSQIPSDMVESWRLDGVLNAPVYSQYSTAVQLDLTAFEEAGITDLPDDESWTWEDFMGLAQSYADAAGEGAWGISNMAAFYQHAHMWIRQNNEEVFDEEGNLAVSAEVLIGWFEFWQKGMDSGAVMPSEITGGETQWTQTNHQTAIYLTQLNQVTDNASFSEGHQLKLAKYPVLPDATDDYQYRYYTRIVISQGSKNAASAGAFVNYMLNDERGAEMVGIASGIPVNPTVVDSIREIGNDTDRMIIDMQERINEQPMRLRPEPPPAGANWQSLIETASDNIFNGGQDIAEAVNQALTELQGELDRG